MQVVISQTKLVVGVSLNQFICFVTKESFNQKHVTPVNTLVLVKENTNKSEKDGLVDDSVVMKN